MEISSVFLCFSVVLIVFMVIMLTTAVQIVPEHQRLDVYRLGRYIGQRGPGIVMVIPIIDKTLLIDVRDKWAKVQAIQEMFDAIGETMSPVSKDGSVEIDGKVWNAISVQPIPPQTRVRVTKVILEVESIYRP